MKIQIILIASLLFCCSCVGPLESSPDFDLPQTYYEEKNNLGFIINDNENEAWVAQHHPRPICFEGCQFLYVNFNDNEFRIDGDRRFYDSNNRIYNVDESFELKGTYRNGQYHISKSDSPVFIDRLDNECNHYYLDTLYNNYLTMSRLDSIKSGTFKLRLITRDSECPDSIMFISKGRFNWK